MQCCVITIYKNIAVNCIRDWSIVYFYDVISMTNHDVEFGLSTFNTEHTANSNCPKVAIVMIQGMSHARDKVIIPLARLRTDFQNLKKKHEVILLILETLLPQCAIMVYQLDRKQNDNLTHLC